MQNVWEYVNKYNYWERVGIGRNFWKLALGGRQGGGGDNRAGLRPMSLVSRLWNESAQLARPSGEDAQGFPPRARPFTIDFPQTPLPKVFIWTMGSFHVVTKK